MVSRFPDLRTLDFRRARQSAPVPRPPHAQRTTTYLNVRDMFVASRRNRDFFVSSRYDRAMGHGRGAQAHPVSGLTPGQAKARR